MPARASGRLTRGRFVEQFQRAFADAAGPARATTVNRCPAARHIGLRGWEFAPRHGVIMPTGTVSADPRVGDESRSTRVKAWVRHTDLDELSHPVTVLRGRMSRLGRRAGIPRHVAQRTQLHAPLPTCRPGPTNPATPAYSDEARLLSGHPDARHHLGVLPPGKFSVSLACTRRASVLTDPAMLVKTVAVTVGEAPGRALPDGAGRNRVDA